MNEVSILIRSHGRLTQVESVLNPRTSKWVQRSVRRGPKIIPRRLAMGEPTIIRVGTESKMAARWTTKKLQREVE